MNEVTKIDGIGSSVRRTEDKNFSQEKEDIQTTLIDPDRFRLIFYDLTWLTLKSKVSTQKLLSQLQE